MKNNTKELNRAVEDILYPDIKVHKKEKLVIRKHKKELKRINSIEIDKDFDIFHFQP